MKRRASASRVTRVNLHFELTAHWCASRTELATVWMLPRRLMASIHHKIDRIANSSSTLITFSSPISTRDRCDPQNRHAYCASGGSAFATLASNPSISLFNSDGSSIPATSRLRHISIRRKHRRACRCSCTGTAVIKNPFMEHREGSVIKLTKEG